MLRIPERKNPSNVLHLDGFFSFMSLSLFDNSFAHQICHQLVADLVQVNSVAC